MAREINVMMDSPVTGITLHHAGFEKWDVTVKSISEEKKYTISLDNGGWTPVSESLPEPGTSVIVTAELKTGQRVVRSATYTEFGFSGNGNMHDVLAWIKMPDAYEGE